MISSDSRTISGLRRSSTPSAPIVKRMRRAARYQVIVRARACGGVLSACRSRVAAEDDAADRGHEQHDRRDLEREQVVGEEELPISAGLPNDADDLGLATASPSAGGDGSATTITSTRIAAAARSRPASDSRRRLPGRVRSPPRYAITNRNMTITAPA